MTIRRAQSFLLALLALSGLAASGPGRPVLRVPLRVHVLQSSERALDAAHAIDAATVRDRLRQVNQVFAPAGVEWVVESVRVEHTEDEAPFRQAPSVRGLRALVPPASRISPHGVDLYVARDLSGLRIGGVWMCSTDGVAGHGAAFVPVENSHGAPIALRKWAHELGHALGLPHAACEAGNADRLMMSSKCSSAEGGRVGFSVEEIATIRAQAATGGPKVCRSQSDDTAD